MRFFRFYHTSFIYQSINKSLLGDLRKKTGYSLSNCRKALEMHNNDLKKAEEWLKEQAKALGWKASMKVQDRKALQGLVGVAFQNKKLAMVEVNCETEFVSKNDKFKTLVELVAQTCLQCQVLTENQDSGKIHLSGNDLKNLQTNKNMTLADEVAILIGSIGENMILRRAICYETIRKDLEVFTTVHPPPNNIEVCTGKFAAFVSLKKNSENVTDEDIGLDLCKHIIGTNPKRIGVSNKDGLIDSEKDLIHQEFLLDNSITVGELLKESDYSVVDFERIECGEIENDEINEMSSNEKEEIKV